MDQDIIINLGLNVKNYQITLYNTKIAHSVIVLKEIFVSLKSEFNRV